MIGHVIVHGEKVERSISQTPEGLRYRDGTADLRTLHEIPRSYGWLDVQSKNVLDIGAHVGGFSHWAVNNGATYITAVEPDECNYALLKENILNAELGRNIPTFINAAVVGETPPDTVKLWYTPRGFSHGMNSTQRFQGRYGIDVQAVTFHELLAFMPEVIKIDCEGAEYQFLDEHILPPSVRQIAIEIHLSKPEWRTKLAPELIDSFKGWETVVPPKIGDTNWTTLAGWRR